MLEIRSPADYAKTLFTSPENHMKKIKKFNPSVNYKN